MVTRFKIWTIILRHILLFAFMRVQFRILHLNAEENFELHANNFKYDHKKHFSKSSWDVPTFNNLELFYQHLLMVSKKFSSWWLPKSRLAWELRYTTVSKFQNVTQRVHILKCAYNWVPLHPQMISHCMQHTVRKNTIITFKWANKITLKNGVY